MRDRFRMSENDRFTMLSGIGTLSRMLRSSVLDFPEVIMIMCIAHVYALHLYFFLTAH